MFERLMLHGAALARRAAQQRRAALAEALREDGPEGVRIEEVEEGVAIEGRGAVRRFALDPELRWLPLGLARGGWGRRR